MCAMNIHASELAMDFPQSSASVQPCEGAFYNPPSGDNLEAHCDIRTLNNLDCPVSNSLKSVPQLWPSIATIRENIA